MSLHTDLPRPSPSKAPDPVEAAPDVEPTGGRNLLTVRPIARMLRSRLYPGLLQWIVATVFVVVAWQLLLGPDSAHDNLGTALMWVLWWPLIPIVFLVLGRFWCAVCPFGKLNDLVQRLAGVQRPVPRFLKRYGIWIIDASFLLITWADHVWGVVESPWGSGVLLLLLITAVVASGAFLQRRAFCRYLCFLGGLAGNYARTGMLALRANHDICKTCTARAACFNGTDTAPGCPLFEFPRTMDSNANCNLCANCIKNCPNGAITLTVRPPSKELWFIRKPRLEVSFLAAAIMGIVFIQNITMLRVWNDALAWIEHTTGLTSYAAIFTIAFVVAVSVPVGALAVTSRFAARVTDISAKTTFARFGYALIPLDIAGHIAHNLFHLLAEGKAVLFTAMPLFGAAQPQGSTAFVSTGTIQLLQYLLIVAGVAASLYTAYRIARSRPGPTGRARVSFLPFSLLIVAFGVFNVVLFTLPMAMRM